MKHILFSLFTADLVVEKLRLNVHIPYLLVLLEFFKGALETVSQSTSTAPPSVPSGRPQVLAPPLVSEDGQDSGAKQSAIAVYGSLKRPEIVLFADPTKADSRVAVLYVRFP